MKQINLFKGILVSLMQMISATVSAQNSFEVDGFYYENWGGDSVSIALFSTVYPRDVVIPSSVTYENKTYRVTAIREDGFAYLTRLRSVSIPNSITSIGYHAFCGCYDLTSVTIPNSVRFIGDAAFYDCQELASVTLSNNLTSIEDDVFYQCFELASITIPNSVKSIGDMAFYCCASLSSINIPNSVTSIGKDAFFNCVSLPSINIPNSVTSIGEGAFGQCFGLFSVTIGSGLASIGDGAFNECNSVTEFNVDKENKNYTSADNVLYNKDMTILVKVFGNPTSFTVYNGVKSIGDMAFLCCEALSSINIPNSVTSIGNMAFLCCEALSSINIPNSVTSIGEYAFSSCSNLTSIYCKNATPCLLEDDVFDYTHYQEATLFVPEGSLDAYKNAEGWKNFFNVKEEDEVSTDIDGVVAGNTNSSIKAENGNIVIKNAKGNISVYTLSGAMIQNVLANGESVKVNVPAKGMYIVKTSKGAMKVAL